MSRDTYDGPYTVYTRQKNACKSWGSLPEHENLTLKRARQVFDEHSRWPAVCCKILVERLPKVVAARYAREKHSSLFCVCGCYNCLNGFHTGCNRKPKCRKADAKEFGMKIIIKRGSK